MTVYMLDTNTISDIVSNRSPIAASRLKRADLRDVTVSSFSYAEIWFGLRRRPAATKLRESTRLLLAEIEILPWSRETAQTYAVVRAEMESSGKSLSVMDMLIATHALSIGAILVSADRVFRFVPQLTVENWTQA